MNHLSVKECIVTDCEDFIPPDNNDYKLFYVLYKKKKYSVKNRVLA